MKSLLAILLLSFISIPVIADEALDSMMDNLEKFAEDVDALDRGETTVYEVAASTASN